MSEPEAAALTQRTREQQAYIYDQYARGNRDAVFDALAPEVTWTSVAGPGLPWGGTRQGRAGVEEFFAALDAVLSVTAYDVQRVIADGEWVTVLARARARVHATDHEFEIAKADVLRLRDGRILEFHEHYDTATVLEALQAPRGT